MAEKGNQGGIQMWPSEEVASRLYDLANWGLIVGLVVGVISTVLIVWIGNVKEGYLRTHLSDNQRIASEANLKIATLTNENLKLQTILLPRRIVMGDKNGDKETRQARFKNVAKYRGTYALIQPVPDFEAQILASDISVALINSGWQTDIADAGRTHISNGLITSGVQVVTLEESPFGFGGKLRMVTPSKASHAAQSLVELLNLDLGPPFGPQFFGARWEPEYRGKISILTRRGFKFPNDVVVILVGMKPVEQSLSQDVFRQYPAKKDK